MSTDHGCEQSPRECKPRSWKRYLLRAVFIYVVVPYLAIIVIFGVGQRWFIYHPTKTVRLSARTVDAINRRVEDLQLRTRDGLTLHGWRFRSVSPVVENDGWIVIYFPGNAGCRRDRVDDCADFTQLNCDVVLFDYRGYGDNEGSPGGNPEWRAQFHPDERNAIGDQGTARTT